MKNFSVDANIVKLQVWDISNADRTNGLSISSQNSSQNDNNNANNISGNHLDQIGRLFYKNALGLFLVMDLSKPLKDDNSIKRWVDELNSKVTLPSGKKLPILLVCTKADLVNEDQEKVIEKVNLLDKLELLNFINKFLPDNFVGKRNLEQIIEGEFGDFINTHKEDYEYFALFIVLVNF